MTLENSDEDQRSADTAILLKYLLDRTNPEIGQFLQSFGLAKTGTKQELGERIERAIERGEADHEDVIAFLDGKAPWGKQHVFLFTGPPDLVPQWRDTEGLRARLENAGLAELLNTEVRVALPERLTLTGIKADDEAVAITAVARRDASLRRPELDFTSPDDRALIAYHAYEQVTVRNTVRFEWDLVRNEAMLQVTQLPSGHSYEEVRDEFASLVEQILDLDRFRSIDLRRAIKQLQAQEEGGGQETRLRGVDYETLGGRQISGRSGGQAASLFGEAVIDQAMSALRNAGEGRIGNFYWRSAPGTPLSGDVHVYVLASAGRINITIGHPEEVIRHVLGRIRHHSR